MPKIGEGRSARPRRQPPVRTSLPAAMKTSRRQRKDPKPALPRRSAVASWTSSSARKRFVWKNEPALTRYSKHAGWIGKCHLPEHAKQRDAALVLPSSSGAATDSLEFLLRLRLAQNRDRNNFRAHPPAGDQPPAEIFFQIRRRALDPELDHQLLLVLRCRRTPPRLLPCGISLPIFQIASNARLITSALIGHSRTGRNFRDPMR